MDFFETLKQLKNIKADFAYTEKSRRIVLASPHEKPLSGRLLFFRILEGAGSLALAGVLVFAIAGGFSSSRYLSPISFQGIDPAALHAEAQAIDMQINIANLNYAETSGQGVSTAMTVTPVVPASSSLSTTSSAPAITGEATGTASSSMAVSVSSTVFSINNALQQLEQ